MDNLFAEYTSSSRQRTNLLSNDQMIIEISELEYAEVFIDFSRSKLVYPQQSRTSFHTNVNVNNIR